MKPEKDIEIIAIQWKKIVVDKWEDAKKEIANEQGKGLDQIYGNHYAYGKNSLLYIGETTDSFANRLLSNQRLEGDFIETTVEPDCIYLGHLINESSEEDTLIGVAEAILLATHTPALNTQKTYRLSQLEAKYKDKDYLVLNLDERGNLLPEVSTIRNSYIGF